MAKEIKGLYTKDQNFITVFAENTIYTIARNGDWKSVAVGQYTAMGPMLTQEVYDKLASECDKEGTFMLS